MNVFYKNFPLDSNILIVDVAFENTEDKG